MHIYFKLYNLTTNMISLSTFFINESNAWALSNNNIVPLSSSPAAIGSKGLSINEITWTKPFVQLNRLLPSQKQLIISKVVSLAFNEYCIDMPTKLNILVSSDNYIVDGHHRWAAMLLVDPFAKVEVYKVNLSRNALISALNVYTTKLNRQGQPAKGNIKNFNPQFVQDIIDQAKERGLKRLTPEIAIEREHLVNVENAKYAITDVPEDSLLRQDMPVIYEEDIETILNDMKNGSIDWYETLRQLT